MQDIYTEVSMLIFCTIGLGQCSALEFARHGCQKLLLVDMSMSKLETTKSLIVDTGLKPRLEIYEGNVSDEASIRDMVKRCVEVYGRLEIAVNCAGVSGPVARTSDVSMQDFDFVCGVNERGVSSEILAFTCADRSQGSAV